MKQKQYAAIVKEKLAAQVGAHRALTARIQLLNIAQRKVDPMHQGNMLRVTLLKLPYKYDLSGNPEYPNIRSGQSVMIIGYHNSTKAFAQQQAAHGKLVGLIGFEKKK